MNKQVFFLPFGGFYNSLHSDAVDAILEMEIESAKAWNIEAEITDAAFEELNFTKYCTTISNNYAEWLLTEVAEAMGIDVPDFEAKLISPKEYNFETDKIMVSCDPFIPSLTQLESEYPGITREIQDEIKQRYTSCDGFISFVEPNPDMNDPKLYNEIGYLTVVFYILCGRVLDSMTFDDLDMAFSYYAYDHSLYYEAVWDNIPDSGKTIKLLNEKEFITIKGIEYTRFTNESEFTVDMKDFVKCNNCCKYGYVSSDTDICPDCSYEGGLMDIEGQLDEN